MITTLIAVVVTGLICFAIGYGVAREHRLTLQSIRDDLMTEFDLIRDRLKTATA